MHASVGNYADPSWHGYAQKFCAKFDLPMAGAPPTGVTVFSSEAELTAFLATYFRWQNVVGEAIAELPVLAGINVAKKLLHVGCGDKTMAHTSPGFIPELWRETRFDGDPSGRPDILGDLLDLSAVPRYAFDAVFSSHTLEHLYWHEVPKALSEMATTLKPAGFVLSWVPDLQAAAKLIAEDRLFEVTGYSPFGPLTPFDLVYSHRGAVGRDKPYMAHHCGFTQSSLINIHLETGYGSAIARPRIHGFDLQILATPRKMSKRLLESLAAVYFS
jgi:SAM-dependent methyltransferase